MRDLSGWAIVTSGRDKYIGRVVPDDSGDGSVTLSPVFEYLAATQVRGDQVSRPVFVVPLEMMPDAETLECALVDNILHLTDQGPTAQQHFSRLLDVAEEFKKQLRARASGLVLVGPEGR